MDSPLIDALMNPANYPHEVNHVERMETHISWVLLAGNYAYKIKKPVDFGFLDFSTLAARKHFCQEELRLNRRHAESIYLDVVSISGPPDAPVIEGSGEVIDYAVRMRRFDQDLRFDRLLERQTLQPEHIDQLAAALASLHAHADRAGPESEYGQADTVIAPMRDNFSTLSEMLPNTPDQTRIEALRDWTEDQFSQLRPRIEQRKAAGHVREGHGDAHLGNVVLHENTATLFDCLEFSPDLRCTDTVADLAFTVMDLQYRGAEPLSWRLLDAYLSDSGDHAGLDLLDFYVVYRAMVRAKVAALSLADAPSSEQSGRLRAELEGYLDLACRVSDRPPPILLLTSGVSGSGKSWLSERLLERCGLIRLRSDVERKRLHQLPASARTESGPGEGLYTPEISARTYRHLAQLSEQLLRAGLPVVVDAAFLDPYQRAEFHALAERLGVCFGLIACAAPRPVLEQRICARQESGGDPSEAGLEVLRAQLAKVGGAVYATDPEWQSCTLKLDTSSESALDQAVTWVDELRSGG